MLNVCNFVERKFSRECCGLEQWWQIKHPRTTGKHVTVRLFRDGERRLLIVRYVSLCRFYKPELTETCVVWLCNLYVTKYILLCKY